MLLHFILHPRVDNCADLFGRNFINVTVVYAWYIAQYQQDFKSRLMDYVRN